MWQCPILSILRSAEAILFTESYLSVISRSVATRKTIGTIPRMIQNLKVAYHVEYVAFPQQIHCDNAILPRFVLSKMKRAVLLRAYAAMPLKVLELFDPKDF
jgi:hypothetical protein